MNNSFNTIKREVNKCFARKSNKHLFVAGGVAIATVTISIIALLVFAGIMALVACGVIVAATYFKKTRTRENVELENKLTRDRYERERARMMHKDVCRMKKAHKGKSRK